MSFEIIRGDYGREYVGVIKGENLAGTFSTCVIYIWDEDDMTLVDGKSCTIVDSGADTHLKWTPASGDIPKTTDYTKSYYGLFKMTGTGVAERTFPFEFVIKKGEP